MQYKASLSEEIEKHWDKHADTVNKAETLEHIMRNAADHAKNTECERSEKDDSKLGYKMVKRNSN